MSEPVPPSARHGNRGVETRSDVVAGAALEGIRAAIADQRVVAGAADEGLRRRGAGQRVVAWASPRCATAPVKEELAPQASGRSTDLTKEPEPSWMIGIRNLDAMDRSGPPEFSTACRQVLRKVSFWQFCDVANYVKVGSFPHRAGH